MDLMAESPGMDSMGWEYISLSPYFFWYDYFPSSHLQILFGCSTHYSLSIYWRRSEIAGKVETTGWSVAIGQTRGKFTTVTFTFCYSDATCGFNFHFLKQNSLSGTMDHLSPWWRRNESRWQWSRKLPMKAPLYLTRFPLLKIDFTSTFSIKVFKTKKRDRSSMEGKDAEGEGDWKRLKVNS